MCGIAGILRHDGRPVSAAEIRAMTAVISHRGPDDEGTYVGPGIGLGMRRLSIIDLATGRQPIANEDASVWVVFNGEIYNFQELRRDLEARGHRFSTGSDTETIVHLYEEHGARCVERLRGMFAFALWDEPRRQLLLARDRLGIKPLYYCESHGQLIFASELKAILEVSDVERRLNWHAVNHLFAFLTTPRADSIVEGVRKLEPAHVLRVAPGKPLRTERYWDVRFEPNYARTEADVTEELQGLIEESTRLHLMSDVPLGVFLSGGIDSSTVVATMSRLLPNRVKTFSIGFNEQDYSELEYARQVADAFGAEHHELVLAPDVVSILEDLAWYLDEPFGDSSAIPTYMVSKFASEHVTVVLSGDGGDELFAGYDKYVVEGRERRFRVIPAPVRAALGRMTDLMPSWVRGRNFLRHMALPDPQRYLDALTLLPKVRQQALFSSEVVELFPKRDPWAQAAEHFSSQGGSWLSGLQYADLHTYLPLDILTKVDRMSMAHSIEVRPPLLDHKLVEFAATIPPDLKLRRGMTKYVLKRAMRGTLPDPVIDRPKRGFAIPLGRWFRGQLREFVNDLLLSETSRTRHMFNPAYLDQLANRRARGHAGDLDLELWTLISFELWCRTFLSGGRSLSSGSRRGAGELIRHQHGGKRRTGARRGKGTRH